MTDSVIARRYANAIFSIGNKAGKETLNKQGECLLSLGSALASSPDLELALKSPVVSADEKKSLLGKVLDKIEADKTVRNFCYLLADKERLSFLRDIVSCYRVLLDEARGVKRGVLTTAIELSDSKKQEILNDLQKKSGSEIELSFAVDKDILGGMILNIGDRVLDASLRAQLEILRDTFKRGE